MCEFLCNIVEVACRFHSQLKSMMRNKLAFAIAMIATFASGASQAASFQYSLPAGRYLDVGDYIEAQGYCLIQQGDGNLVLYYKGFTGIIQAPQPVPGCPGGRPVWATYKNGTRTHMQEDGNFVQYTSSYAPVWASNTGGRPSGNYSLEINFLSGELQILDPNRTIIWSTPKDPQAPTTPTQPPRCANGQLPTSYPVCVQPNLQSRATWTISACSVSEAQMKAAQLGYAWGACN